MKNILKIVFLGIIGFSFLVYLTMPQNIKNEITNNKNILNISYLPVYFEIVNKNPYTKIQDIFQKGMEKYIVVLNHDSLAVFTDLYKYTDKNIVLVANVSNTPWLIKQLAVNGKLEQMYKDSTIPLINDNNGSFIASLGLKDNTQNKYFIFKLNSDGTIIKSSENVVPIGSLEKEIPKEDLKNILLEIVKYFN